MNRRTQQIGRHEADWPADTCCVIAYPASDEMRQIAERIADKSHFQDDVIDQWARRLADDVADAND